VFYNFFLH